MSVVYQMIGRLVVSLVSRRYRDEIRLIGLAAIVAALFAVLWGLRAPDGGRSGIADFARSDSASGRKRRSGAFMSIR
jgi:hypothetical protein